ncbi:ABC transporter ATP-binding protein [Vagococcus sp.]|uniref:ABC transporter ATP-binding protein n=1 Tax=Vagococcus sp. TaxID=1933889 RepID=UPI003F99764B
MNAIEFIEVTKEFKDGDDVIIALKPTTLTVKRGEFIGIIGPSGSGKSTFLTLAGGLQTPSRGQIIINDTSFSDESEVKRAQLRFKQIGFILQASNLVPFLTVEKQFELVDKVNKEKRSSQIKDLLDQFGVGHLATKYPEALSGGERQRVAIARALYNDPAIILADEPTASLDTERARDVVRLLAKETKEKNKATLMVTHDTRLINECDRLFVITDGNLVEKKLEKKS